MSPGWKLVLAIHEAAGMWILGSYAGWTLSGGLTDTLVASRGAKRAARPPDGQGPRQPFGNVTIPAQRSGRSRRYRLPRRGGSSVGNRVSRQGPAGPVLPPGGACSCAG